MTCLLRVLMVLKAFQMKLTPYPQAQLCIVHMVRNSMKYVSWKDYKAVTGDLKRIYQSVKEEEALLELDNFCLR
jgi:putative transposase